MGTQSAPADRFADIVIITGLAKELEWFSKTIGVQFTRTARQGTSYLRGRRYFLAKRHQSRSFAQATVRKTTLATRRTDHTHPG